jgi:hypothetical protein
MKFKVGDTVVVSRRVSVTGEDFTGIAGHPGVISVALSGFVMSAPHVAGLRPGPTQPRYEIELGDSWPSMTRTQGGIPEDIIDAIE